MRCVASQKYTSQPPAIRDPRVEGVDRLPLDFERTILGMLHDERINLVVALEVFPGLAGQLHELPAHPLADCRQFHARTARIAIEGDLPYAVIPDDRIDHQPVFRISRTYELCAKQFADSTGASVTGDHVVRALQTWAVWRRYLQNDPTRVLFKAGDSMFELCANSVEPRQAIEQYFFEFRLIKGAQRRVTKLASDRKIRGHQSDIARIQVADM